LFLHRRACRRLFRYGQSPESGQKRPNTSFDIRLRRFYSARMDSLHAPWRIEYILAPKPQLEESLFTTIAQSSDDAGNLVIARDRTCYALLNRYPYNGGHLMVVPYKQAPDLDGLTDGKWRIFGN
jgi:hypothetical protein